MKLKKYTAIFILMLMLFLPISFAIELTLTKWSGTDNINGFAKSTDTFTVKAKAEIPYESTISPDQLKICIQDSSNSKPCKETNSAIDFDSCKVITGKTYNCSFTTPLNMYDDEMEFQVDLYNDDGNLVKFVKESLIMDAYPPKITNFKITPNQTLGPVNIAYEVEDYGILEGNTDKCSGIYDVEFSIDGTVVLIDKIRDNGNCKKTRGVNYVYSGSKTKVTLCAVAKDFLGRESTPVCADFVMDENPPVISEVALVDSDGARITHVKTGQEKNVKVMATITDEGKLNESTILANLKSLNGNDAYIIYTSKDGDNYYWDRNLKVGESSSGTITVKAKDTAGRESTRTLNYDVALDNTKLKFTGFGSSVTSDDGTPMLAYGSYLIAKFTDEDDGGNAGIGMSARKAYLDLSKLYGDSSKSNQQADNCEEISEGTWQCKWKITAHNKEDGIYNIILKSATSDDLGNTLTKAESIDIVYQEKGPFLPKVIDYTVIPGAEGIGGEAIKGDTVQFTVQSRNFEKAYADFTEIGGNSKTEAINCEYDQSIGMDLCLFESIVDVTGPASAHINFTFIDQFEQTATAETDIIVYELIGDKQPNFWAHTVECSPQPIDRKTTSQIAQKVVCKVNLKALSAKDTANIVGPSSIYDCEGNVSTFIDSIQTINTAPGSTSPYLMIQLPVRDYLLDTVSFDCPLKIYSKSSNKLYALPEEEKVHVDLKFYDLPLGEIYENKEKEIKEAIEDARELNDVLKDMVEVMNTAEEICKYKNVITSAISTVTAIVVLLGVKEETVKKTPFAPVANAIEIVRGPLCKSVGEMDQTWITKVYNIIDSACMIVNCQAKGGKESWNIGTWTGGAAPWCTAFENALGDSGELAVAMGRMQGEANTVGEDKAAIRYWSGNMKDNIYQSFACLCIPGIINNLNKIAQINCNYATCLSQDYKENGLPISYCRESKHYLQCAYVWGGPLFDLVPFSQFFESISVMLGTFIANPVSIATTVLGVGCDLYCETPDKTIYNICAVARIASEVGESVASIQAMFDSKEENLPGIKGGWCEEMEKWAGNYDLSEDDGGEYSVFE